MAYSHEEWLEYKIPDKEYKLLLKWLKSYNIRGKQWTYSHKHSIPFYNGNPPKKDLTHVTTSYYSKVFNLIIFVAHPRYPNSGQNGRIFIDYKGHFDKPANSDYSCKYPLTDREKEMFLMDLLQLKNKPMDYKYLQFIKRREDD